MAKKLTPKQVVLRLYPGAVCYRDKFGHFLVTYARLLGSGAKEAKAWEDAANRATKAMPDRGNDRG